MAKMRKRWYPKHLERRDPFKDTEKEKLGHPRCGPCANRKMRHRNTPECVIYICSGCGAKKKRVGRKEVRLDDRSRPIVQEVGSRQPGTRIQAVCAITKSYSERRESLTQLGFMRYADYLASPLWATIRGRVLAASRFCCGCKATTPTQVHHKKYSAAVLAGQDDTQLVALYRQCHERIEFNVHGHKVSLEIANKRLDLLATTGSPESPRRKKRKRRRGTLTSTA